MQLFRLEGSAGANGKMNCLLSVRTYVYIFPLTKQAKPLTFPMQYFLSITVNHSNMA